MKEAILIAVSRCLLGENVRFNGANSHKKFITEELSQIFNFYPVCPEVSAGLGIPREPVYFEKNQKEIILKQHKTDLDLTEKLQTACQDIIKKMPILYGFILKKSSPSCGLASVKIYNVQYRVIENKTDGLFVQALKKAFPLLPIENEGRLMDPNLKEHFIKRVFLTYEMTQLRSTCQDVAELIAFHTRHKILLRLHHPMNQKSLGRLVAEANKDNLNTVLERYESLFLSSFLKVAKKGNHYTILQRILREINKLITKKERDHLQEKIKAYHLGILSLAIPMELIKHYLIRYDIVFLKKQSYLYLYPESLGLTCLI